MQRLTSIDLMRGIAIIFMVLCHFPIFLSPLEASKPWLYFFSNHVIGDLAAPIFLFLSGFSQVLSTQKPPSTNSRRLPKALRRGIAIFFMGLLFSVSMHGLDALFEWDILPLIGMSTIVLYFVRNRDPRIIALVAFVLVALAPALRMHSDWLSYWGDKMNEVPGLVSIRPSLLLDPAGEYKPHMSLMDTLKGLFLVGYFPIFPWMAFPLLGYAIGKMNPESPSVLISGVLLAASGLGGALLSSENSATQNVIDGYLSPLSFYPLTPTMFAMQLGAAFVLFSILRALFDCGAPLENSWWLSYFRRLSRYSLTVYVFHHIVIFWPLLLIERIRGIDLYEKAMSTQAAFIWGVFLLGALGPLLHFWDQRSGKFSLEWCLAHIVGS